MQLRHKNVYSEIYTHRKDLQMKDNIRDREYRFRANKQELELIEERFKATEFRDISKYLRHMATVGGVLINVDSTLINEMKRAVLMSSNNINMIARQLNATGKIDEVDVEQLKADSAYMRDELQKITCILEAFSECEKHSRNYYWDD